MRLVLAAGSLLSIALANPHPAAACSPPRCWAGAFLPGDGANVPANVPAFVWRPMQDFASGAQPDPAQVELVGNGTTIALTATPRAGGTWTLAPTAPLVVGETYQLVDHSTCEGDPSVTTPSASIHIAAAAPLPTLLGTTNAAIAGIGDVLLATTNGSCSAPLLADRADLTLALAPSALPWRDVLEYSTVVDDELWSQSTALNEPDPLGSSYAGRAKDRVFHACEDSDAVYTRGVPEGTHEATIHAKVPNTTLDLVAVSATFPLTCNDPITDPGVVDDPADGGGCSSGGATGLGGLALALVMARSARRTRSRDRA